MYIHVHLYVRSMWVKLIVLSNVIFAHCLTAWIAPCAREVQRNMTSGVKSCSFFMRNPCSRDMFLGNIKQMSATPPLGWSSSSETFVFDICFGNMLPTNVADNCCRHLWPTFVAQQLFRIFLPLAIQCWKHLFLKQMFATCRRHVFETNVPETNVFVTV